MWSKPHISPSYFSSFRYVVNTSCYLPYQLKQEKKTTFSLNRNKLRWLICHISFQKWLMTTWHICSSPHSWALYLPILIVTPWSSIAVSLGLSHLCPTGERLNNMDSRCTEVILQLTGGNSMAYSNYAASRVPHFLTLILIVAFVFWAGTTCQHFTQLQIFPSVTQLCPSKSPSPPKQHITQD